MSTWQINISFIKKKTENMRKMRQNAAFRIQQGENLWKLKYFSSATAVFSENAENLEFIVCFGLWGSNLLRIY